MTIFTLINNWLLKKCGVHICEEFTQWSEIESRHFVYLPRHVARLYTQQQVEQMPGVIIKSQTRQCTLCGKIEKREIT